MQQGKPAEKGDVMYDKQGNVRIVTKVWQRDDKEWWIEDQNGSYMELNNLTASPIINN